MCLLVKTQSSFDVSPTVCHVDDGYLLVVSKRYGISDKYFRKHKTLKSALSMSQDVVLDDVIIARYHCLS